MLLTIDESKIDELLRFTTKQYEVTPSHIAEVQIPISEVPPSSVCGTMSGLPAFTTDTREYLLSLRRKIVDSRIPLRSAEELDREIDEIRGRKSR